MSFSCFLNFEKVSIRIIEDALSKMTNDNITMCEEPSFGEVNEDALVNNIIYGSVAATYIVNLFETSINTIVGRRINCSELDILKSPINVKLQLLSVVCEFDYKDIKSVHSYEVFNKIVKLRNDVTHFKSNMLGDSSMISEQAEIDFGTLKEAIVNSFSKSYIENGYKETISLISLVCSKCGLYINNDCNIIDCDGRDDFCEYIVDNDPKNRE